MSDLSQSKKNLRGIVFMLLAMGSFVFNDAFVKLLRVHWDTGQLLVIRGCFALALLAVWLRLAGAQDKLGHLGRKPLILRGALEGAIAFCFITALGRMALADITAILLLAPLIITALSMIFFSEKIGWRRWSAVVIGFIGALLVIRPGGNSIPLDALILAFLSVLGVGIRDLLTRKLPAEAPSVVVSVTSVLGTMAIGAAISTAGAAWQPVTPYLLLLAALAAGTVVAGNYSIIEACRDVELSAIMPFRYSVIVWAVLLGIVVFDEWPSLLALGGIFLIVASGLYTAHRERVRRSGN